MAKMNRLALYAIILGVVIGGVVSAVARKGFSVLGIGAIVVAGTIALIATAFYIRYWHSTRIAKSRAVPIVRGKPSKELGEGWKETTETIGQDIRTSFRYFYNPKSKTAIRIGLYKPFTTHEAAKKRVLSHHKDEQME